MKSPLSASVSPLPSPALEVMMGPVPESCRRSFILGLTLDVDSRGDSLYTILDVNVVIQYVQCYNR